jgi:hypothetical protein
MAGNRSESNAVGNSKFTDLNMSFYPTQVDSKVVGNPGYNPNLKGFWSAGDKDLPAGQEPDYNMAEHVNALADAVMAIQRILGVNPHIDFKGGNTTGTVSTRIAAAENKDAYYDKRYGGQNWTTALGQTILTHTHGGGLYEAPKINLADEVSGKLKKINIDITQATGITGEDLAMSRTSSTKISDALNDKLSISQGGTIEKGIVVKGFNYTRTSADWIPSEMQKGSLVNSSGTTKSGVMRRATGTGSLYFIDERLNVLEYGKYVLGVRMKVNTRDSATVATLRTYNWNGSTWVSGGSKSIKGTDFEAANQWQMFYLVFDAESVGQNGMIVRAGKAATTASVTLDMDSAFVMPTHPAVFDM